MKERLAYERIFTWYRRNKQQIKEIYAREDTYSAYSAKLVAVLPTPKNATLEDMVVTAQQVLMGLLEWAYHQKDSHGRKMHEYARVILANIDAESVDARKSRLSKVVSEFREQLRR
jgi:hypothetical protein